MDLSELKRVNDFEWQLAPLGAMRVPVVIFADAALIGEMDDKVLQQAVNVAALPGIVKASYAMPDAHWGYGFPIGGVAAFDAEAGGVVSAGGVGFDISCGVRLLTSGLSRAEIEPIKAELAHELSRSIPAGVGSHGRIVLEPEQLERMLEGGAAWAVGEGYGEAADLERIEERGCMAGAVPDFVSEKAKKRQRKEMGTLGSGNHYLEIQEVAEIFDEAIAARFGLALGDMVLAVHCGSRGLGHQIGTEFLREMAEQAPALGITLPDRELACAPIKSDLGQRYLGAMRAGINCALANRQIITHLMRGVFARMLPEARLELLFDVSHNTCKEEEHEVEGAPRKLYVHRKGATRAFGPGHPDLPEALRDCGQPVLIGGSMGTGSFILAGTAESEAHAFGSACHGAGRAMSRHQAAKRWHGRELVKDLAEEGIVIKSPSMRGVAEEAPGAYKDVAAVVEAAERAGLANKVARVRPVICVKG
jgi:tRNA-splicing ligase RtcB